MLSRRQLLKASGPAALAAAFRDDGEARVRAAGEAVQRHPAEAVAANEDYWRDVQSAFTLDRTIINLNNGGCCPSPRVVHDAFKRYLDISNQAPVYHMWQVLEPNIESVRRQLAAEFGCDAEELAITRNASEALQIAQLGVSLRAGDEVVTTNQDYGRMLDTWEQRVRRDGIRLSKISFPVPPKSQDELADRLLAAITPATRVLHFCHITNLTGQIFPVRRICDEARRRGVTTIVDGAHAFAHFPYKASDLGCDYYGTSLHKWLLAPIGTGFLYVRRENISGAVAADAGRRREEGRHPEVRGDRHASGRESQRDCRSGGVPSGDRDRTEGRAAALPAEPVGDPALDAPEGENPHQPRSRSLVRDRNRAAHPRADAPTGRAAVGGLANHRDPDRPRRVRRRAGHAERLHDDRRDRHLRLGHGADRS